MWYNNKRIEKEVKIAKNQIKKRGTKMEKKLFVEKVVAVQTQLKAPKNCYNSFGKYKYRNCEDILEAVKPLLQKEGLLLTISDTIVGVGDRIYIQAECVLTDGAGNSQSVKAFAREPLDKKGMDASQVTGAASSYARKYALNGLFLIDDTKDADSDIPAVKKDIEPPAIDIDNPTADQLKTLSSLNIDINKIAIAFAKNVENLTSADIAKAIKMKRESLKKIKGENNEVNL